MADVSHLDFLGDPADRLQRIVGLLEPLSLDDDAYEIAAIGIGPLEVLFHQGHEDLLWTEIQNLARTDVRFRHALASTWAYSSVRYEDRQALLRGLEEQGSH